MRGLIGYAAAFVAGAGVLYGVLLAGSPWPPVGTFGLTEARYERTAVQVLPGYGDDDLRAALRSGYEVESTTTQPGSGTGRGSTTYILRRRLG